MRNLPIFLLFFFATYTHRIFSQDAWEKVALESCSCIEESKKNFTKEELEGRGDPQKIRTDLGICIIKALSNYKDEIPEASNMDFTNQEQMRALGEKAGIYMMNKCPDAIMLAYNAGKELEKPSDPNTLEGKISTINIDDWVYLVITDAEGNTHKLTWLTYFEGSERYTEAPESLKGKNVRLTFSNEQVYLPKLKEYVLRKVIQTLAVLP